MGEAGFLVITACSETGGKRESVEIEKYEEFGSLRVLGILPT